MSLHHIRGTDWQKHAARRLFSEGNYQTMNRTTDYLLELDSQLLSMCRQIQLTEVMVKTRKATTLWSEGTLYVYLHGKNLKKETPTQVQFVCEVNSSQGRDVGEIALPLPVKEVALQRFGEQDPPVV